jgi:dTDP-4-dehydrorhamnose 3,5-epimerase
MQVQETALPGLLLIEPKCFRDERGFFLESFQQERYRSIGVVDEFVQDNLSRSNKDVLRGLHFRSNDRRRRSSPSCGATSSTSRSI